MIKTFKKLKKLGEERNNPIKNGIKRIRKKSVDVISFNNEQSEIKRVEQIKKIENKAGKESFIKKLS